MVFTLCGYRFLVTKKASRVRNTFPDALNILMSAVTAGDSLMQAIGYGDVMHNPIGREFKLMGDRLKLGESLKWCLNDRAKTILIRSFCFLP